MVDVVERVQPSLSRIYRAIRDLDPVMDVTLQQLKTIVLDRLNFRDMSSILTELIQESILEKVGEVDFNGVKVDKEKLRALLSFPCCDAVLSDIDTELSGVDRHALESSFVYLEKKDGEIVLPDSHREIIAQDFRKYTETQEGTEMMERLTGLAESMNGINDILLGNSGKGHNWLTSDNAASDIKGLRFESGRFVVDHVFVVNFDSKNHKR